jgi:hypothetical protein
MEKLQEKYSTIINLLLKDVGLSKPYPHYPTWQIDWGELKATDWVKVRDFQHFLINDFPLVYFHAEEAPSENSVESFWKPVKDGNLLVPHNLSQIGIVFDSGLSEEDCLYASNHPIQIPGSDFPSKGEGLFKFLKSNNIQALIRASESYAVIAINPDANVPATIKSDYPTLSTFLINYLSCLKEAGFDDEFDAARWFACSYPIDYTIRVIEEATRALKESSEIIFEAAAISGRLDIPLNQNILWFQDIIGTFQDYLGLNTIDLQLVENVKAGIKDMRPFLEEHGLRPSDKVVVINSSSEESNSAAFITIDRLIPEKPFHSPENRSIKIRSNGIPCKREEIYVSTKQQLENVPADLKKREKQDLACGIGCLLPIVIAVVLVVLWFVNKCS